MRVIPHPLLERDIIGIAEHVFAVSGDGAAARKRIFEARELIEAITAEVGLGSLLNKFGWLACPPRRAGASDHNSLPA